MNNKTDIQLIRTLFSSFPNELFLCHTALEHLRTDENLSPAGLLRIKTIEQCHRHMHHLCHMIDFITSDRSISDPFTPDHYDSGALLSGITDTFLKTVAGYIPVSATHCSKPKMPLPVYVNKTMFETVFLNLLYCCIKSAEEEGSKQLKLALSVSETKKNIVFHIRTNTVVRDFEFLEQLFSDNPDYTSDIYNRDAVLALSVEIATAFVKKSGGRISYTPLKSGYRYDICLPKISATSAKALRAPKIYIPSVEQFNETFAEFILASLMKSDTGGGFKK